MIVVSKKLDVLRDLLIIIIFFSGKHNKYCIKKEYLHTLEGHVVNVSQYYPGSHHDFSIFRENIMRYGELLYDTDTNFEIMADKGYEGIKKFIPAQIPIKSRQITQEEAKFNKKLGSVRVICERYYGRMKHLFKACSVKIKNSLDFYDDLINLCCALTNFHVEKYPLTRKDLSNNYKIKAMSTSFSSRSSQNSFLSQKK